MYWNPNYCSFTKEPINDKSIEIDEEIVSELIKKASQTNSRIINGENNFPTIENQ